MWKSKEGVVMGGASSAGDPGSATFIGKEEQKSEVLF